MSLNTNIKEIGSMVKEFESSMLVILFGTEAPDELREISVIHEPDEEVTEKLLKPGQKIHFGGIEYTVEDVGTEANKNFSSLGHLSIYFTESQDLLPGAIQVSPSVFPEINIGDTIVFEN